MTYNVSEMSSIPPCCRNSLGCPDGCLHASLADAKLPLDEQYFFTNIFAKYPETFFNQTNLKSVLPQYYQHVFCPTRGPNILNHCNTASKTHSVPCLECTFVNPNTNCVSIPCLQAETKVRGSGIESHKVLIQGNK